MLDITAFSNALRQGTVSFLDSLRVRPFIEDDGTVASFTGDDAVVYPLARDGDQPRYALRLPLEHGSGRTWPVQYADLAATGGTIGPFLPRDITILDVDDIPGTGVALIYEWVPGESLTGRVARARARHDRDRLSELLWPLADIAEALRVSGMTHGDIAPGNLIVRPDGGMVMVDLDRMGYRDGPGDAEPRRRAGYRLPRGGGWPVEEDAFALLVLMATCAILADASVSIEHDRASEASHPMLLFSSWDLMDPQRSRLVRDVESQLTPLSKELLDLLIVASSGPPERVPALVRDGVRQIRRFATKPEPDELGSPTDHPGWFPFGVESGAGSGHAPIVERETSEPAVEWTVERGEDTGWPKVEPVPPPTALHVSSTRVESRTAQAILEDLRAIPGIETHQARAGRRAARAERRRETVAGQLRRALEQNDRDVLVRLAMSGALAELGDSDRSDLLQVVRALAHDAISRAVFSDDDGMIVAAVDESVFQRDTDLDPEFRDRVRLARDRERWAEHLLASMRERDADACLRLFSDAPEGAVERLPASVRSQATRLIEQHEAEVAANVAIGARDADGLAMALSRLVVVRPTWSDLVDREAVLDLLGEDQIEQRLVSQLAGGRLSDEDQWMVDVVIAAGRLPEATRLAGLAPRDVDAMIHREV